MTKTTPNVEERLNVLDISYATLRTTQLQLVGEQAEMKGDVKLLLLAQNEMKGDLKFLMDGHLDIYKEMKMLMAAHHEMLGQRRLWFAIIAPLSAAIGGISGFAVRHLFWK